MMKDKFSSTQLMFSMSLYILGTTILSGADRSSGHDTWFSILAAMIAAVPFMLMLQRLLQLYPGMGLFEIYIRLWGRVLGGVAVAATSLFVLWASALALYNFIMFMQIVSLPKTPLLVLALVFGAVCAVGALVQPGTLGRFSLLAATLVLLFIIGTTVLVAGKLDPQHLTPVLETPPEKLLDTSFSHFCIPFMQAFLLTAMFGDTNLKKKQKPLIWGLLLAGALLVLVAMENVMALGNYGFAAMFFPAYEVASSMKFGNSMQRVEILVSVYYMVLSFYKVTLGLRGSAIGIAEVFRLRKMTWLVIAGALVAAVAPLLVFANYMELMKYLSRFRFYTVPFQVLLPLLLWITAEIRSLAAKHKRKATPKVLG